MKRKTNLFFAMLWIINLSFLCSFFFFFNFTFAHSATITTSGSISLDVSTSGDGIAIQSDSINVVSDCRNGYYLTIATPNGADLYKYNDDAQASEASFTAVDGVSILNSINNSNKWGYTLESNPSGDTVFSPLSTVATTLKNPNQTISPGSDINDTFNIYYGVKTNDSIEAGTYKMATIDNNVGAIAYYLTMDTICTQYTVSFHPNGGALVSGATNPEQTVQTGELAKLESSKMMKAPDASSFTDANNNTIVGNPNKLWTFWGWNTEIDGTGDWFKDREIIKDLADGGSTITLYAQWRQATLADMVTSVPSGTEKVIDHNLMQDMSPEICYNSTAHNTSADSPAHTPYNSTTNPEGYHTISLLDYRGKVVTDNLSATESPESYTVSKLADGNCWMTKDLNLGRESGGLNGDGTITLTSEDSDLPDDTTFVLPASSFSYISGSEGNRTPQILINHTVSSYVVNSISYSPTTSYYSWSAATALNTGAQNSGNIASSICPKNWDLPNKSQYPNLRSKESITSATVAHGEPYNFIYGGYRNASEGYYNQTTSGYYWTSTYGNSSAANWSYVSSNGLSNLDSSNSKSYGAKLRCVASNGTITVNYDGNGTTEYPTVGMVSPQENVEKAITNAQPGTGFTRDGWVFNDWNTSPDGSGISVSAKSALSNLNLKPGENITLYAQWLPQYTVTYINNCASWANCSNNVSNSTTTQTIKLNDNGDGSTKLGGRDKFKLTGWKILEWSTNADGTGNRYSASSTYNISGANPGDSINLYAHWVPVYTVQYDGNGSDNDSTGMGSTDASTGIKTVAHTNVAEGDTFDLFASNFKRTNYGFVGWSTDPDAWAKLIDNNTANDAKIWGPNELITAPASNGTSIVTLYAVWAPAEKNEGHPIYLQGWTGCSTMTAISYDRSTGSLAVANNSITVLTDERDNETYAVAKLADGNCWMVENLRLADAHEETIDGVVQNVPTVLSVNNTNIKSTNNTLPITNIYNADSSLSTKSYSLSPSSSSLFNASSAPFGWCTSQNATCYNQSRLNTTNIKSNSTPNLNQTISFSSNAHESFDTTVYSYGNYYNWYSATAGYGTYSRTTPTPTDGDLCPAGWHLPYGGNNTGDKGGKTSGGYSFLDVKMGGIGEGQSGVKASNRWRMFPNNFVYSGDWDTTSTYNRGESGDYLTASAWNNNETMFMYFEAQIAYPGNNIYGHKRTGYSVRCVVNGS